jgi:hypothetical protein
MWRTNLTISILAESAFIIADEMIGQGFASSRDDFERCWLDAPQFFANRQRSRHRLIKPTYVDRLRWRLNYVMDHVPEATAERVRRVLELIDQAEFVATALAR